MHVMRGKELQALNSLFSHYGVAYRGGDLIVTEDDESYELYVVLRGSIEFSIRDPETSTKRVLRKAGPGEIFGEISCFSGLPRSATAIAVEDSVLLRFERDTAIELLRNSPEFAMRVIQTLGDRLRSNTELLSKIWQV